jgi:hypothetical protein
MSEPDDKKAVSERALPWFGVLMGFVLVAYFLWLTYEMFVVRVSQPDLAWARSMAIYSVIEAFALAAAGALMGVQIQSGRVKAEAQRADKKEAEADAAKTQRDAAKADSAATKSELGGYRSKVREVRNRLDAMAGRRSEQGGAGPGAADLEVVRALLNSMD